jgi:hypothetical protein
MAGAILVIAPTATAITQAGAITQDRSYSHRQAVACLDACDLARADQITSILNIPFDAAAIRPGEEEFAARAQYLRDKGKQMSHPLAPARPRCVEQNQVKQARHVMAVNQLTVRTVESQCAPCRFHGDEAIVTQPLGSPRGNVTSAPRQAASTPHTHTPGTSQVPAPQRKSSTRCPGLTDDISSASKRVDGESVSHASSPGLPAHRMDWPPRAASNVCPREVPGVARYSMARHLHLRAVQVSFVLRRSRRMGRSRRIAPTPHHAVFQTAAQSRRAESAAIRVCRTLRERAREPCSPHRSRAR